MSSDYIPNEYKNKAEEIMREMYKLGYKDGISDGKIKIEEAYNNGLNAAWKAARKIVYPIEYGGIAAGGLRKMFGEVNTYDVLARYSAAEAIEKIKEYESHVPDKDVGEIKGLFIPNITAEMFRNGCLESIEALMAEGKLYDIECPREVLRQMKGASE